MSGSKEKRINMRIGLVKKHHDALEKASDGTPYNSKVELVRKIIIGWLIKGGHIKPTKDERKECGMDEK